MRLILLLHGRRHAESGEDFSHIGDIRLENDDLRRSVDRGGDVETEGRGRFLGDQTSVPDLVLRYALGTVVECLAHFLDDVGRRRARRELLPWSQVIRRQRRDAGRSCYHRSSIAECVSAVADRVPCRGGRSECVTILTGEGDFLGAIGDGICSHETAERCRTHHRGSLTVNRRTGAIAWRDGDRVVLVRSCRRSC